MNYHVFIVDNNTFKVHLEYMFAGTGAGDKTTPFILNPEDTTIHSRTEINLVSMIADISRVRVGDKIIFYLQANSATNRPGMFFGVFKAISTAFYDANDDKNYLKAELKKALTFRIKIEPDTIYPLGVSEHYYLDSLENIEHPSQMCWSLIYRKLKGNRGCTMINDYEFDALLSKIKYINNNKCYNSDVKNFTFNISSYAIEPLEQKHTYEGRSESLDVKDRLLCKANKQNKFECHLQAYIMQNIDSGHLRDLFLMPDTPFWIGNEVSCGVGMQRIDVMIRQEKDQDIYLRIIELKCVSPEFYIIENQLPWYIEWVTDYIVPNYTSRGKNVHIIPTIVALNTNNKEFINKCKKFNLSYKQQNKLSIEPLEYIAVETDPGNISFKKVKLA